jgi:hypothetical protein
VVILLLIYFGKQKTTSTDLPDLGPEFEIEDQGDEGVVINADNWGDWPPAVWDDPFFFGLPGHQLHLDEIPQTPSRPHFDDSEDEE